MKIAPLTIFFSLSIETHVGRKAQQEPATINNKSAVQFYALSISSTLKSRNWQCRKIKHKTSSFIPLLGKPSDQPAEGRVS